MALDLFQATSPSFLTKYVRGLKDRNKTKPYTLEAILPTKSQGDLEYKFNKGGSALAEAATYRAYGTESPIGETGEFMEVRGKLPTISEKLPLTEYEDLRLRKLGDDSPEMKAEVLDYAEELTFRVLDRVEMARAEALFTGKVELAENGVVASIDFGRSGTHNANADTAWSNTSSADPIADLIACQGLIETSGGIVTDIVMNPATYAKMKQTDAVRNAAAVNGIAPGNVTNSAINTILESYDLPGITVDRRLVRPKGGSTGPVIANDRVILADRDAGTTPFGVTAEQLEFANDGSVKGGGLFAMSWKDFDPVTVWTKVSGIVVPVLSAPNLTVGLDVS